MNASYVESYDLKVDMEEAECNFFFRPYLQIFNIKLKSFLNKADD